MIVLFFLLFFGADQVYVMYLEECHDKTLAECMMDLWLDDEETAKETVTATGALSGVYGGKTRSVNISLTFPLAGWAVTGSFDGECDGKITGNYAGGTSPATGRGGEVISGGGGGSCGFILPAEGKFSGTVNQTNRSVFISGTGSAAGISGEGSLTLTY